jgi:hypothetical protein
MTLYTAVAAVGVVTLAMGSTAVCLCLAEAAWYRVTGRARPWE